MIQVLSYDPGALPTKPAPKPNETLELKLSGWPPYKDENFSIRNSSSPQFAQFSALREAARSAMAGRCWSHSAIELQLKFYGPAAARKRPIDWYLAGVMDCLGGSHGFTFTYLPIVFEDDCQVTASQCEFAEAVEPLYELRVIFLGG